MNKIVKQIEKFKKLEQKRASALDWYLNSLVSVHLDRDERSLDSRDNAYAQLVKMENKVLKQATKLKQMPMPE